MKKYLILLLFPLMAIYSCVDDSSAYESQQKENVPIDNFDKPGDGSDTPDPGVLIPGIYEIGLDVVQPDGSTAKRRFKYYMPSTLKSTQPISLVINFHKGIKFDWGVEPTDPIWSLNASHQLNQRAAQENWIVCFPVSGRTTNSDGSGQIAWTDSGNELAFVDAIVDYFKASSPAIDVNRIYGIGDGEGGDFLFRLALERADTFAAIVPYGSTYSIPDDAVIPARAVPVMMTALGGSNSTALDNMGKWAEKVGGYFAGDRVDTEDAHSQDFEGYAQLNTYSWSGAKADVDVFIVTTIASNGTLNFSLLLPYMAQFINAHPRDNETVNMYVTVESNEITAKVSQKLEIPFNYTTGATIDLVDVPASWNPVLEEGLLKLTAPDDFYADVARSGKFGIRATLGGKSAQATVSYELQCPKNYFEVGDIYYNADYEPLGVVVWVNNANIREARIISLEAPSPPYYTIQYGALGLDFDTPDKNDGAVNTAAMAAKNATKATPLTSSNSVFIWAANYSYKDLADGWYMPAINEIAAMYPHKDAIAAGLSEAGGVVFPATIYSSTTELGGLGKIIHYFDLGKGVAQKKDTSDEYTGFIYGRAFRKVTM